MVRSAVWVEPEDTSINDRLHAAIGGHPLVSAVLGRRGIHRPEDARVFLDATLYQPSHPTEIPNLKRAALRIESAISKREPICVWGDFDVDGQTATTLLFEALRALGAEVCYYIPIRKHESHGVHIARLEQLISQGISLLLTCDTGVTAHQAVAFAGSRGVDTIITDHHDLPDSLPDAYAVVNPKMLPEAHPLHDLPGVAVAYKVIEALCASVDGVVEPASALDLVALGIVADLAYLRGDVRYLLKRGLERIKTSPRLSLRALMRVAEVRPEQITEEQIAFIIAPRLNAAGRLADANAVVDFLSTNDRTKARIFATQLEGLNARRRLLCDQVTQAALAQIENDPTLVDESVLVIAQDGWPAGVIGIVASRLAERFHLPTVVFSISPDGYARGSARSIEGVDISAAIATQGELLDDFGGHPMAAGMSIQADRIPVFRRQLSATIRALTRDIDLRPQLHIDGYVDLHELTLDFTDELDRLAPFGPGNPNLILATKGVSVLEKKKIGRDGEHLELTIGVGGDVTRRVIWWHGVEDDVPEGEFDLAYHVRSTEYRGQREVQLTWIDARPGDGKTLEFEIRPASIEFVDHRKLEKAALEIESLERQGIQIWVEGGADSEVSGVTRDELVPAETMAIWTPPPGPAELKRAIQLVSPRVVHLFNSPTNNELEQFLHRLTGMIKFGLRKKSGRIDVRQLATATAQRVITVRKGVFWLIARGDLLLVDPGVYAMTVVKGPGAGDSREAVEILAELQKLIDETLAFRRFYQNGEVERIFDWVQVLS